MAEEERNLFPIIDLDDFTEEDDTYEAEYRPSLAWDFEKGDFVRDKSNKVLQCDGVEAFKTWCVKTITTERFTCLAYDDDLGTEMIEAADEPDNEAVELAIERTIEEALMANPRTEAVEDFIFDWEADTVHVTCTVTATEGWESFILDSTIQLNR